MAPPKPTRPATEPTTLSWEKIGGKHHYQGGPRLLSEIRQAEYRKRPCHRKPRYQQDGRHHRRTQSERQLSRHAQREFAPHQVTRKPSAEKTTHPGGGVRNPGKSAHCLHIESARIVKIFRKPEKIEVPGCVAEKLGAYQSPGLANSQQVDPAQVGWNPRKQIARAPAREDSPAENKRRSTTTSTTIRERR